MKRTPLSFPNQSRSYDARQHCVRFWAYDQSLEIPFFVNEDALRQMAPDAATGEPGLLRAFDLHRDRILKTADKVYVRHCRGSYTLTALDM